MLLILISSYLLSTTGVQTFLANKAVVWLNESLDLNAEIGIVKITFPNKISLGNVYLADEHNDTLIYVKEFKTTILGFNKKKMLLKTANVTLNNGRLYMRKYPEDSVFNFKIFLNKLASNVVTDTNALPFQWKSRTIEIDSMRFIKHRLGCSNDSCTNIFIDYSKIDISNFYLNGAEVEANIKSFTYKDRNRFDLLQLSAKVSFQDNFLSAQGLKFQTEHSDLDADIRLEFAEVNDFEDFDDQVELIANLRASHISSNEFREWLDEFPDFGDFSAQLHLHGTTNGLVATDVKIEMGKGTMYEGDITVMNSTHANDIFIDANMTHLHARVDDFNKYIAPITSFTIPERLAVLDHLNMHGKYKGDLNDIEIKGTFETLLGEGELDILLTDVSQPVQMGYKGFLDLRKFALGVFVDDEKLGLTTLKGTIDGKGTTVQTLDFNGDIDVDFIDFNGYRYADITILGRTTDSIFSGKIRVNDPNLDFDFDGLIDFKSGKKEFDFVADLKYANLFALGISKDSISEMTSKFVSKLEFEDDNNFKGFIKIKDITYTDERKFYFFDSINLTSNYYNKLHVIKLNSQLINASFDGDFNVIDLIPSVKQVVGSFYKYYVEEEKADEIELNCNYQIELNNTELLWELFAPELYIDPGTKISGFIKMPEQDFEIKLKSSLIKYNRVVLNAIDIGLTGDDNLGNLDVKINRFKYNNVIIDSNKFYVSIFNDSVNFKLKAIIKDSIDSHVSIAGNSLSKHEDHYELSLTKSRFNIGLQDFEIIGDNEIIWHENAIEIDNIFFKSDESNLAINGVISDDRKDELRFSSDNLDMNILNYFVGNKNTKIAGFMNGDILLSQALSDPKVFADFRADSLVINNDWVGDVEIESEWNYDKRQFEFKANVKRGLLPSFNLDGFFKPDSNAYILATADFNRFRVSAFNPLLSGILSDLRGTISGGLTLKGPLASPSFSGSLTLSQVALTVPYLKTDYNIVGQPVVEIRDTAFVIPKIELRDTEKNTRGFIEGSINHKGFQAFNFDIKIDANRMLAMNLEKGENEYFYGKAFATGDMTIKGPVNNMVLNVNLKTEKDTEFNLPITSNVEVQRSGFITYVYKNDDYSNLLEEIQEEVELRGLTLRLNIEVTPEAKVKLIMDETVGDIIQAQGKGQIRLEMKPNGDIEMFGDYEIQKGDYLFTMRNLLNKPFVLETGSTMSWKGDPYNANINLRAKYRTRTKLTGVVTSPDYTGQRVTVDLYLILKGALENPTISFEIDLPGSQPSWQEELNNKMTNVDRLNQQAFSILMLNTFWNDDIAGASVAEQGLTANTTQMVFTQFSNWISSGTDFIDIDMNYSNSTQAGYSDELEIALSKNFYDDRITVNGILDVPIGGATTTNNTQTLAGDVEVLYKITEDGRIRTKAFNRSNQNNPARDKLSAYTQGIGIMYQKDFENWGPFLRTLFISKKKREREEAIRKEEEEKDPD